MSQAEASTVIANPNVAKSDVSPLEQPYQDLPTASEDNTKTPGSITPATKSRLTRLTGIAYMVVTTITSTGQGVIFRYLSDMPTGMVLMVLSAFAACFLYAMIAFQDLAMTSKTVAIVHC